MDFFPDFLYDSVFADSYGQYVKELWVVKHSAIDAGRISESSGIAAIKIYEIPALIK